MAQETVDSPAVEQVASPKQRRLGIPILFTATAFTGAALLFIVEPLIAKMLLPEFGGASTVWTLSTFFFQVAMLIGYLFIHFATKLGPRRQPWLQLALVLPALLFLPIALPAIDSIATQEPFTRLLLTLTVAIGLPFLVLSTTGPLIQRWYSWTSGPRSDDPYFLYAASNGGSFIGLLAYPFLIEPFISLEAQRNIWSVGFVLFLLMVAACGFIVLKESGKLQVATAAVESVKEKVAKLGLRRQLWWIFLAFLPASLQLGLVSHLTTDVASFPLLWIIPLTIYLATMIVAFGRKSRKAPRWAVISALVLSLASFFAIQAMTVPNLESIIFLTVLLMVTLGIVSYAAHGTLAADRPETVHLTKYFVLISFGGALGGAFNGLLAPLLLMDPIEFQLVLIASLGLLAAITTEKAHRIGVAVLVVLLGFVSVCISVDNSQYDLKQGRSFYGAWSVGDLSETRVFAHGTTTHGSQFLDENRRDIPTSYYALGGPLSELVDLSKENGKSSTTVIGLGTGAMAAYADENSSMSFIEVDQQVIDVAEDTDLFTYLSDARERGATVETILGDGRLKVGELKDGSQDLIAIDAFSSDSIPVHLLTLEAFEEYAAKLKDDGMLAVHISNRIFDLSPIVVANARELGYEVLLKTGRGDAEADPSDATWMVLTKDKSKVAELEALPQEDLGQEDDFRGRWLDFGSIEQILWTDDHSSVLEAISR